MTRLRGKRGLHPGTGSPNPVQQDWPHADELG